jgi:dTDP-4-amino-4,6-dideoxy-D-galactose acyltransferase
MRPRTNAAPGERSSLCELLEWDTAFFGRRIARVTATTVTADTMSELLFWCSAEHVECLYFLADSSDPMTIRLAEEHGFQCVDIRVTLERCPPSRDTDDVAFEGSVRAARPDDVIALRAIARTAFRGGRFHLDRRFAPDRADMLYEIWIEKSCLGGAEVVLVAERRRQAVGFLTCHVRGDATGQIGLVGTREDARGSGVGRAMVSEALRWFAARGAQRVRVVTQGRNRGALRLYERSGFLVDSVELYYHRWFTDDAGAGSLR